VQKFPPVNDARDVAGVIAPPPLIVLAAFVLGEALDWFLPSFVLRDVFEIRTRSVIGAILIATGAAMAIIAWRRFVQAGTEVEPWKPSLTLVTS
jgi:protein-S-isoprenylcysteine O-methyltransferase Ste14